MRALRGEQLDNPLITPLPFRRQREEIRNIIVRTPGERGRRSLPEFMHEPESAALHVARGLLAISARHDRPATSAMNNVGGVSDTITARSRRRRWQLRQNAEQRGLWDDAGVRDGRPARHRERDRSNQNEVIIGTSSTTSSTGAAAAISSTAGSATMSSSAPRDRPRDLRQS